MRKFLQKALAAILLLNAILVTPVFAEGNPVITIIPAEVQAALTDNLSASPQLWKNDAGDITLTLMRYAASDASKDPAESGEEFSIEFPVNIETAGQYELSLIASRTDVNTYSHYAISVDGGEALDVKSPNVSEAQPYADSTIANAKYALRKYSMLNLYNLDAGAHTVKITATTRGTSRVDIYLENIALAYKGGLPDYSQITVDGRTGYTDEGNLPVSTETWDNGIMSCGKLRKGDADVATGEWFAAYSFNCEIPGNYALYMSANRWDINTYSHYAIAVDDKENYIPINNNTAKNITIPDAAKYGGTANYALRNYDVKNTFYLDKGLHTVYVKATTNAIDFDTNASIGVTIYLNYMRFSLLTPPEPTEQVRVQANDYQYTPDVDLLNIVSADEAPSVMRIRGIDSTLPEDGLTLKYSFETFYDGVYDLSLSTGNYNNVYLSKCAVAVDAGSFTAIDAGSVKTAAAHPAMADMAIYETNLSYYLTAGQHTLYFKIIDESRNNIYAYFEYADLKLNNAVGIDKISVIDADGNRLSALADAASAAGKIEVTNNTATEQSVTLIAGLYADGVLEALDAKELRIPAGTVTAGETAALPIPHTGEVYELRVMVWDALDTMSPLAEPYIVSDNGIESLSYDLDTLMLPFWETTRTYSESVMMVSESGNAEDAVGELYHTPKRIISVTNTAMDTEYIEGVDWEFSDGKLKLLSGTRVPYLTHDDLYPEEPGEGFTYWNNNKPDKILFSESEFWHKNQILVTYDHDDLFVNENLPVYSGSILKHTAEKLKNGEDLYIVQNGDSISVGNNMSGCKNIAPYLPIWGELFAEQLRSNYDSNITFNNTSVGGMTSVWGLENVDKNIAKLSPDLVIIGFGMNDASGNMSKETFKSNVSGMIDKVRAQNPDAVFILVSSIVGNPAAGNVGMTIPQLREGIYELAQEYTGVAVADMTSIHSQLLEKKKYLDMTGNNINHINDYLGRWYAQILSALLIEG